MLAFFRKYQRYIFIVVTVVIIISFSFFGTYSTLNVGPEGGKTAFYSLDGTPVSRANLEEMVLFVSSDNEDKLQFRGMWGPNFLNDGVIRKDLLETGIAEVLFSQYRDELKEDLQKRGMKEKHFVPYVHPHAKFVSAESVWKYFAPELQENLEILQNAQDPTSPEAFAARVRLYLAEKKFPALTLKQVLRYQQRQYSWLPPDEELDYQDLSLFGYHTLEDWFGPKFLRLAAQFLVNAAKVAERQGYVVSSQETLADLIQNCTVSYQQNRASPYLGVASKEEYFQEQLRRMGMDRTKATKVWRQVLLFRRLFHDVGNSVFVDPLPYEQLQEYANEFVEGDLYRLPEGLRLANDKALQKFQVYLQAISKDVNRMLPEQFLTVEEVAKQTPELVQKRYFAEITEVDKRQLQGKVSIKETWKWETEDKNWELLKKEFPELGIKKGDTEEERFVALESLDEHTRAKIDAYARAAIVDSHPEWLEEALSRAQKKKMVLPLKKKGGNLPFVGINSNKEKKEELSRLLEESPLGEEFSFTFTADSQHVYRIKVLERSPEWEVLTFAEANAGGALERLVEQQLEDKLAEDANVRHRLYAHVKHIKEQIEKGETTNSSDLFRETQAKDVEDHLPPHPALGDQWKLEKTTIRIKRKEDSVPEIDPEKMFQLEVGEWSDIHSTEEGNLFFFQATEKGVESDPTKIAAKVDEAHHLLSREAQRFLSKKILVEIVAKGAVSLSPNGDREEHHDRE